MLYLLDKDVKTVKWNGIPLHEASSAIVKEEINGDLTLTIRYPITDSGIYQLIKEDMLIKAPSPVLGPQLFRIKKPVENDDSLDITAYHISDDVMQRSIRPVSVVGQGCAMALSQMVQNAKTDLGTFSFTSDIMDSRTFNTTDAETLYSVLLDGKHSIVGTWEGELVRDNFALTIKRSRGADRGVVITTHKNLKSYQRTKNSQSVVTRIHAKSTFKAEGAEEETTITVTVDSPLIGNYPYINEKDYENNNAKTVDELRKWAEAKFKNEGIDKISDAIEIEAYELDGQVIHLGDTVNIKSRKHDVDIYKKAIAYEFNALTEEYISITFDDKPGVGGSGVSSGVSNAADVILSANRNTQEVAIERAIRNANQAFDAEFEKRVEEINDGIEQSKAEAERYADAIKQEISTEINDLDTAMQAQSEEHDRQVADILSKTQSIESLATQAKSDAASALARANQVKTEAIADARAQVATVSQALNTAKTELQTAIASADQKARDSQASATALRTDLNLQASKILAQAQAQTALTNRVSTVESLADGTRSIVAELSKTVNKATGDIASVTSRTKTVEDTLSQTRTQYEALTQTVNAQTGQIDSINRKTADLQSGIDGVTERFDSLQVGGENLLLNAGFENAVDRAETFTVAGVTYKNKSLPHWGNLYNGGIQNPTTSFHAIFRENFEGIGPVIEFNESDGSRNWKAIDARLRPSDIKEGNYTFSTDVYATGTGTKIWFGFYYYNKSGVRNFHSGLTTVKVAMVNSWHRISGAIKLKNDIDLTKDIQFYIYAYNFESNSILYLTKPKLENGTVATAFSLAQETIRSEIAEYKRTADQNYAGLQTTVSTLDGKVTQNKTEANQTATQLSNRLTSLETYKDGETTRAQAYFEASKTETAKQLTAERAIIANNYLAKSVYDEDARGNTLKLNEIKLTADTAKQNLATYQNTVNRKLEELTSSTQTLDGKINTASSKVDTVAGQIRTEIGEVEGKIPTEIGGRNLFKGSRDFSGVWHNASNGSFFEEYKGVHIHRTKTAWLGKSQRISVKSGEIYTFSFYAKSDSENDRIVFYLSHSSAGKPAQGHPNNKNIAISTDYQRYSITIKIASDGIIVPRLEKTNTTGFLFFGGFKLETGAIPTDWTPAPEDLIDELSSVKTTITQTASGVEQLSTSLTTTDSKVTTAEAKIRQLISDVSSKVSQTDYNTLTGRVDSAETAITQNATEISKRLTKTQVDKAVTDKGYQTKAQVDNNITGRGYITNSALQPYALATTVQNLVRETADSFSRTISETKALIPTEAGGTNLVRGSAELKQGSQGWSQGHWRGSGSGGKVEYNVSLSSSPIKGITTGAKITNDNNNQIGLCQDGTSLEAGTYTLSVWVLGSNGLKVHVSSAYSQDTSNPYTAGNKFVTLQDNSWTLITQTFTLTKRYNNISLAYLMLDSPGTVYYAAPYIHKSSMVGDWSPAPEDLATVTALHAVNDTVDSHTRTIGAVGETGSILDNVSKVTQTAAGLVQEVSGTNGLKTQVSTLAGSYAIKNLTKAGDVLGQINLNKDGSVRINEGLISIGERTYIQDGVITSAKIAGLDAGKISTGELDAARIKANSIDGSKIVFDDAFFNGLTASEANIEKLFAKDAFATSVQAVTLSASKIAGGILTATNGALKMDLNNGQISFLQDSASIRRASSRSASQFMRFEDSGLTTMPGSGISAAHTILGSNYLGSESSSNGFSGLEIYSGKYESLSRVVGDRIEFRANQGNKNLDNGNWVMDFKNRGDSYFYPQKGRNTKNMFLGHMHSRITNVYVQDINLRNGQSLHDILHLLASIAGHIVLGGFSDDTYRAIKDTYNNLRDKGYG